MNEKEAADVWQQHQRDCDKYADEMIRGGHWATISEEALTKHSLIKAVEREREKSEDIRLALEECKAIIEEYLPEMRDRVIQAITQRIATRKRGTK